MPARSPRLNTPSPWQVRLVSHGLVATVLSSQGERERSLESFRKGRDIIAKLTAATPSNVAWSKELDWFERQIATEAKAIEDHERR